MTKGVGKISRGRNHHHHHHHHHIDNKKKNNNINNNNNNDDDDDDDDIIIIVINIDNINNINNNRIQRRNSRLFTISSMRHKQSPTRPLKWPGRNCVQNYIRPDKWVLNMVSCKTISKET